jgi:hypothetical protein
VALPPLIAVRCAVRRSNGLNLSMPPPVPSVASAAWRAPMLLAHRRRHLHQLIGAAVAAAAYDRLEQKTLASCVSCAPRLVIVFLMPAHRTSHDGLQ